MSDLNHAIQLIRQGQKFEAQRILQELLKTQPNNIQAWFWYVETCSTTERRIQVLETCLKMNPGNPQVLQALQHLQVQRPTQPENPAPAQMPPQSVEPSPKYYSYEEAKPESKDASYGYEPFPSSYEQEQAPTYLEDVPTVVGKSDLYGFESYRTVQTEPEKPAPPKKQSWELETSNYTDTSMLSKPKKPLRTYSTFDVWMTAVTSQDERSYADLLQDPEMGLGRAFTWAAIAGVVSAIVIPIQLLMTPDLSELLAMPEFRQVVGGSVNQNVLIVMITMAALVLSPIASIINLAIFGGIQNFLAMFFGGGGNYTRTVYALAAFLAPMTMITSLVAVIPVAGACLSLPLTIYNFVLNVRALKAAHSLPNGAAVGVMLAPTLLILLFVCLFVFMAATSLPSS